MMKRRLTKSKLPPIKAIELVIFKKKNFFLNFLQEAHPVTEVD